MTDAHRNADRVQRLALFQADVNTCTRCHMHDGQNLLFIDPAHGCARPVLARSPTAVLGILLVGEAPNREDTFQPHKGYLTYDLDTDPTGKFMRTLLTDEAGLQNHEINDVLFANAVNCLPARRRNRHPVTVQQIDLCKPWLARLMEDAEIKLVVTMGAKALRAVDRIERHQLTLAKAAGRVHDWNGRKLLPLYHAGLLGRISRSEEQQRRDMRALREYLGR